MATLFSFKHRVDLEEYSGYSKMAIGVEGVVVKTKPLTMFNGMAGLDLKDRGYHLNIKK